jgi:hypothetical protein
MQNLSMVVDATFGVTTTHKLYLSKTSTNGKTLPPSTNCHQKNFIGQVNTSPYLANHKANVGGRLARVIVNSYNLHSGEKFDRKSEKRTFTVKATKVGNGPFTSIDTSGGNPTFAA